MPRPECPAPPADSIVHCDAPLATLPAAVLPVARRARAGLASRVREALVPGALVVLHGIAGCGKSVLAALALTDTPTAWCGPETPVRACDARVVVLDGPGFSVERVAAWRAALPEAAVLVTRRAPLPLGAAVHIAVPPLPSAAARAVFDATARAARHDWPGVSDRVWAALHDALGGWPIAVRLAGQRVLGERAADVATRLTAAPHRLAGGPADGPARHRDIFALIADAQRTLPPAIAAVWTRVGALNGPWDAALLRAALGPRAPDAAEVQTALVQAGLVGAVDGAPDALFGHMPAVRAFAAAAMEPRAVRAARARVAAVVRTRARAMLNAGAAVPAWWGAHAALGPRAGLWTRLAAHHGALHAGDLARAHTALGTQCPARPERADAAPSESAQLNAALWHATRGLFDAQHRGVCATPHIAAAAELLCATGAPVKITARTTAKITAEPASPTASPLALTRWTLAAARAAEARRAGTPDAAALHRGAVDAARAVGPAAVQRAQATLAALLFETGALTEATAAFDAAVHRAQALGDDAAEATALTNRALVEQARGETDAAHTTLEHALAAHRRVGNQRMAGITMGDQASLAMAQHAYARAAQRYAAGATQLAPTGDDRHHGWLAGGHALALACTGARDAAARALRTASDLCATRDPVFSAVLDAQRAAITALGQPHVEKVHTEARTLAAQLQTRAVFDRADEVRLAHAQLTGQLDRVARAVSEGLVLHRDGTRLTSTTSGTGTSGTTTLTGKPVQRRLLVALLEAALDGRGCDREALLSAGWPGERMLAASAKNRLHVALAALRKAGLGPHLSHADGAYRLALDAIVLV